MKRLLFTLLSLLVVTGLSARHISESEALSKARQFLPGASLRAPAPSRSGDALKNLYVFDCSEGGFVIVSADDRTPAILGYSTNGRLDADNPPPGYLWLLGLYDQAIASLPAESRAASTPSRASDSEDWPEITPLIKTQWGQGDPYNQFCPTTADGTYCYTGCVATAMAQVINYHRWPQEAVKSIPGYTSPSIKKTLHALPEKKFDWDNMGSNAIALLMLYCGQSVKMDYSDEGSGALSLDVPDALVSKFDYCKAANLIYRSDYSDVEWLKIAYSELSQGNPLLYFGVSTTSGGHAFIVDGYSDGKFHLNWGWEGAYDGYFILENLNPYGGNDGFNSGQNMLINVFPADASGIVRPHIIINDIDCSENILQRAKETDPFPGLSITSILENDLTEDTFLQIGLAIYDDNGIVGMLSQKYHTFQPGETLVDESKVTIPKDLPEGDYRIITVSRANDDDKWLSDLGSISRYLTLSVDKTTASLQPIPQKDNNGILNLGNLTIDGVTYRLSTYGSKNYGTKWATVLLPEESDYIIGDLYIPDFITFRDSKFDVTAIEGRDISNFSELTSISTPVGCGIYHCPNLTKIEFREKCLSVYDIYDCPRLKSLVFPKYCSRVGRIFGCDSITSLSFQCKQKIFLEHWGGALWDIETLPQLTDVYFSGDIPPVLVEDIYIMQPETRKSPDVIPNEEINIHIPEGTAEIYRHKGWNGWNLIEDQEALPVSVSWDYCGKDENANWGIACGDGKNDVEFAMRIPASQISPYKGSKITAIEFYRTNNHSFVNEVEYIFITSPGIDYIAKQSVSPIRGGWTRVELNEPYIITGDELFVGIGASHSLDCFWANEDFEEDGCWKRSMGDDFTMNIPGIWVRSDVLMESGDVNHPLPIRAIIEGDNLPTDIVIVNSEVSKNTESTQTISQNENNAAVDLDVYAAPGKDSDYFVYPIDKSGFFHSQNTTINNLKSVSRVIENDKLQLKIRNRSPHIVKDIKFDFTVNDQTYVSDPIHTALANGADEIVYIDIPDNLSGRNLNLEVNVNDIDGKPDEISANSLKEVLYSSPASTHFTRKVVLEEIGGTWCSPCVNGIAAIEWMSKLYPDNFIAVSLHMNDEMSPVDGSCTQYFSTGYSFLYARINRGSWQRFDLGIDNLIGIDELFDLEEASISVDATFEDKNINITTETVFGFDDSGEDKYRIAYVLLEDKVGPYIQANDTHSSPLAPDYPDDYLNWWRHQGEKVETTYNNVIRTIHDYDGIKGQLPDKIIEGETYKSSYTMEIPSNVDDAANLRVVTLLLDNITGEILNADQTTISGTPPVSVIPAVIADDSADDTFDIYNLSGIRVRTNARTTADLPSGLYILRTPTTTRKISIP